MTEREKPLVIITRKLPETVEARMAELFEVRFNANDKPMSQAELVAAVREADVLVPTVTDRIDRRVIEQAGDRLKLIANYGNGVDNIDVDAAHARGITVTNTPNVLTEDTADMTMALILAVPRRLVEGGTRARRRRAEWAGWSPTWMLGRRIWGKRLGIVGMGRIGTAVARRRAAFGLRDPLSQPRAASARRSRTSSQATYWESLDQMLARMDIISINCPHTPATYHLLSARRLALLQPHAYHRQHRARRGDRREGADAHDRRGQDRGRRPRRVRARAGGQPEAAEARAEDKVVLLPHMGSATIEGRIDMGEKVIINIRTFMDGHRPPDRILPDRD